MAKYTLYDFSTCDTLEIYPNEEISKGTSETHDFLVRFSSLLF